MTIIHAPEPQRSVATFTLACGLLAIDLAVYSGTEETKVSRHEYVDGDPQHPAGRGTIDKATGELVGAERLVKMCTATSGALVPVDDEQMRAGTLPGGTCDVVCFVPRLHYSYYVTEGVYQVRAKAHGSGKDKRANVAAEKSFAVILEAMRHRDVLALVRFSLRGPARFGLLAADGNLYPVFTHDQVRLSKALPVVDVSDTEVQMAMHLIDAIGVDTPTIADETAAAVQTMVDALAEGIQPHAIATAPVIVDLMGAMSAAIDAAKAAQGKVKA